MWIRHRNFRPSDVFFGAYPRSGSTWTRFILFETLTGQPAGFKAVNGTFRGTRSHQNAPSVLPGDGRFIGTHEPYRAPYKRAIYLVRDGRDVLLSEYAFVVALGRFHGTLDDFLDTFLRGRVNAYGAWHNHVRSWLESPVARTPDLLLVKFEDLRANPEEEFTRIVEFLGVETTRERIQQAIANNSLTNMRAKELSSPQKASLGGRFIREGNVQGWRSKLSPEQLWQFDQAAGDILGRLNYPVRLEALRKPASNAGPAAVAQG